MITIENHVGRLVELRFASPITMRELDGFHPAVVRAIKPLSGHVIACTDLLGARVFDQTVTDRLVALLRQENPRVERNALIVGESAIFSMQIERIIREAGSPNRKAFRSDVDLNAWLGGVLNASERERLSTFVSECFQHHREPDHR